MNPTETLSLDDASRAALWQRLVELIEEYPNRLPAERAAPVISPEEVRALLSPLDFATPLEPQEALNFVARGLWGGQVHTPHPRYFGLFNPAPTAMSIAADALAAAFNPQLASWNHSPFAVEVEQHLVQAVGARLGYPETDVDGVFCSGGAEANHTALLAALVHTFPGFARQGIRSLEGQPRFYVSSQSHHSFIKAARLCGLGSDAVRKVPVNSALRMDVGDLAEQIKLDRAAGDLPFLIAATAGTTNAGVIDPLPRVADMATRQGLWLHVDAAWGGAAALVPELRPVLTGIERADSITFDAHKWLSVSMGAGMFLTRHRDILSETFRITTEYMPPPGGEDTVDPYTHSMQWSRRFIGLKVFLSLLVAGWEGYAAAIRHQTAMGDLLRHELQSDGWDVVNETRLPLVCFTYQSVPPERQAAYLESITREIVSSGAAWISTTRLDHDQPVLRACITNYKTMPEDIHALVKALDEARKKQETREEGGL
jgi:glutamate/tyrosine decarboxylase-like PLP-dependent enzyme